MILVGSRKCNKHRCRLQKCHRKKIIETDTFQSFVNHHRFACSDKCLVYLLLRKVCGMQYNGQTNDKFRSVQVR